MPAKYRVKKYCIGAYYHIYNRGVDGREIFCDDEDYRKFEMLLQRYLTEYSENKTAKYKNSRPSVVAYRKKMSLENEVMLIAYCLLPNHYHLLVQQKSEQGITKLMRRVTTGYAMYFNSKYSRQGGLFENVYRGVMLDSVSQVVGVGKLIHQNPKKREKRRFGLIETVSGVDINNYPYSSYAQYIGIKQHDWVYPVYGSMSIESYRRFIESGESEADGEFKKLMIDTRDG